MECPTRNEGGCAVRWTAVAADRSGAETAGSSVKLVLISAFFSADLKL